MFSIADITAPIVCTPCQARLRGLQEGSTTENKPLPAGVWLAIAGGALLFAYLTKEG